jgi:hypothetical protein
MWINPDYCHGKSECMLSLPGNIKTTVLAVQKTIGFTTRSALIKQCTIELMVRRVNNGEYLLYVGLFFRLLGTIDGLFLLMLALKCLVFLACENCSF